MADDNTVSMLQLLAAVLGTAWLTWRLWTFTIKPSIYPEDPKQYPYVVPFIGHAISFSQNSDLVCTKARKHFNNTRKPFAITLAGETFYIITSPEDTNLVYRNTKTLSFDEMVQDLIETMGMTSSAAKKAFPRDGSTRPLSSWAQEIYRLQFLPGDKLTDLWANIQHGIFSLLVPEMIPHEAVLERSSTSARLSLWRWTRLTLIEVVAKALYGKVLLEIQPDFVEVFTTFDDNSWKLLHKYPRYAARELYRAHAQLVAIIKRYLELPMSRRADACWAVKTLEQKLREYGLEGNDLYICMVMPLWVSNSNTYKIVFWMLALILQDSELRDVLKREAQNVIDQGEDGLADRLEQCERLVATYHEVLRVNTSSASIRNIASDTQLGDVVLRANKKVMIPYRQLHMDESVWGKDASEFDPTRFFKEKLLNRSPSFRPFGGGTTYCTGRMIAMREALTFTAIALCKLDARLPPETPRSTDRIMNMVNTTMPSLGVLPPLPQKDVEVLISIGGSKSDTNVHENRTAHVMNYG